MRKIKYIKLDGNLEYNLFIKRYNKLLSLYKLIGIEGKMIILSNRDTFSIKLRYKNRHPKFVIL